MSLATSLVLPLMVLVEVGVVLSIRTAGGTLTRFVDVAAVLTVVTDTEGLV